MNAVSSYLRKRDWSIYLWLHVLAFLFLRIRTGQGSCTILDIYTQIYYEKRVLAIYILGYLILLGSLCKQVITDMYAIKCKTHECHMRLIGKKLMFRAVSYSFVLNIICYVIVGSCAQDCMLKENIIRVLLIFFTQTIGWSMIGFLYLFLCLCLRHMLVATCITYLSLIFLNLSNYVNYYEKLQYYIRLYYLMFHIEQYPNLFYFLSVALFYSVIGMMLCIFSYNRLQKKEYY